MTTHNQPPHDDVVSTVANVRRLADELEVRFLVASMSADLRWSLLRPWLTELAEQLALSEEVDDLQRDQLILLRGLLRGLPSNLN